MDVGFTAMLQEALERTQVELEQALAENERLRRTLEEIENIGAESDGKTDLTVKMFYLAHRALGG